MPSPRSSWSSSSGHGQASPPPSRSDQTGTSACRQDRRPRPLCVRRRPAVEARRKLKLGRKARGSQRIQALRLWKFSRQEPEGREDRGEHFLFGADILARAETKARYWGEQIGVAYGEPLLHRGPLPSTDPLSLLSAT